MSRRRLFGTDGIRGPFGEPPLERRTVAQLGYHLGRSLAVNGGEPQVALGGDTRASTPTLVQWIASGLAANGVRCRYAGVLPTPGVAFLVRELESAAGVAISASHNPYRDNGIKIFDPEGFKWDRENESALERALEAGGEVGEAPPPEEEASLGRAYVAHLAASLAGELPLDGLTVALDCANGAATPFAAELFSSLGASVHVIGDRPDGTNINRGCGSTHPAGLRELVREVGADMGAAFDGDADRVVLVDERGELQDGDSLLYLWAKELLETERLGTPAIVATTMSNLGLEQALAALGIETVRCDVGDRVVAETLRQHDLLLGGEQSGHIIHLGFGPTGDGLLTALQMAALRHRSPRTLSEMTAPLERFPQVLVNVPVSRKPDFEDVPAIASKARTIERHLGADGRLLLRYSGTEPLARVMIEGRDQGEIDELAHDLAAEIGRALEATK